MSDTPEHRAGFTTRSGDNHVIGGEDNAEAVNVEQAARDAEAAESAKLAKRQSRETKTSDETPAA